MFELGRDDRPIVDEEHRRRHERCWKRIMGCLCLGSEDAIEGAEQRAILVRQLAVISAEYTHSSPSLSTWAKGLSRMATKAALEDEENFSRNAPPPSIWTISHNALDLGVKPPVGILVTPPLLDIILIAAHFAKFAVAAYSKRLYHVIKPTSACLSCACCFVDDHGAFQRLSGVSANDIICADTYARPFKPVWWLCIDRESNSVVLAIRGTFSTSDVLSDLLARQVTFEGHVVHEGVLISAKWLFEKVLPSLRRIHDLRDGHLRLVVTGHSLGGAVAALLTWMLRLTSEFPTALCFTYGTPMIVDPKLAERMEHFVVSMVNAKDMVPRLSRKSVEDLRDAVAVAAEPRAQRLQRLEATLEAFGLPAEPTALHQTLARMNQEQRTPSAPSKPAERSLTLEQTFHDAIDDISELPSVPMWSPGWQLHLQRRSLHWRSHELKPILWKRTLRHFVLTAQSPSRASMETVRPALTMWTDHFPQSYMYMCEVFAERLRTATCDHDTVSSSLDTSVVQALIRVSAYFSLASESAECTV